MAQNQEEKVGEVLLASDGEILYGIKSNCRNKGYMTEALLGLLEMSDYDHYLEIGENNPMTTQNFSKIMGKSNKKIEKILEKFLELEMLVKEGETFLIKNWDKYQSIEKYEKYQKQGRERQRRYREKHKGEIEKSNVIQTLSNAEEKNTKDLENNKEENIREENENGFRKYKM